MTDTTPAGLSWFNLLSHDGALAELLHLCASTTWADQIVAQRPYETTQDLVNASTRACHELSGDDLAQALARHPRIGDVPAAEHESRSRQEQAAVQSADVALLQALAAGNAEYEQRFGHIYLVRASGRSAQELLAILQRRLGNELSQEALEIRRELAEINAIRLSEVVGSTDRS